MVISHLRPATRADIPALTALIDRSVRALHRDDYTAAQIESGLASAYGVDTTLIDDGTYFVLEVDGAIVAAGGWSKHKTLCGGDLSPQRDDALLDPALDAAKIRAFYVDPGSVRRGFGSLLLEACEKAARDAGFTRFEMGATLTGVRLYERRGYLAVENMATALPDGVSLPVVRMVKDDATTNRR
jgi:GNAT superfamily N-acetyltransferase